LAPTGGSRRRRGPGAARRRTQARSGLCQRLRCKRPRGHASRARDQGTRPLDDRIGGGPHELRPSPVARRPSPRRPRPVRVEGVPSSTSAMLPRPASTWRIWPPATTSDLLRPGLRHALVPTLMEALGSRLYAAVVNYVRSSRLAAKRSSTSLQLLRSSAGCRSGSRPPVQCGVRPTERPRSEL
jgi:hypothetical protein